MLSFSRNIPENAVKNAVESFRQMYAGTANTGKPVVMYDGVEYKPLSITQKDAQWIESRQMSLVDAANLLGISSDKLGDGNKNSYNSLEIASQNFLDETIDPWFVRSEQEHTLKCLRTDEIRDETHYIEFNRRAIIRIDHDKKTASRLKQIEMGELSPNEGRALESLPPRADGLGDEYLVPKNFDFASERQAMIDAAKNPPDPETDATEPNPKPDEGRSALPAAIVDDYVDRAWSRFRTEAVHKAANGKTFCKWVDTPAEYGATVTAAGARLRPITGRGADLCCALFGVASEPYLAIRSAVEQVSETELKPTIEKLLDEWGKKIKPSLRKELEKWNVDRY